MLTRLYGLGRSRARRLSSCGIRTIRELADCSDLETLSKLSGFSKNHLFKIQLRAHALLNNEIYKLTDLPVDNDKLIFFDIETDIGCRRVWLIGCQIDGKFERFYADNWRQERKLLQDFSKTLDDYPEYTLMSYSGTNFDYRVVQNALRRHGINGESLTSHSHIDLCSCFKRCFVFPTKRYALKELGSFLGYPFKHSDIDGLAVALAYHRHVELGEKLDPKIFEYNRDDAQSICYLLEKTRNTKYKSINLEKTGG